MNSRFERIMVAIKKIPSRIYPCNIFSNPYVNVTLARNGNITAVKKNNP